MVNRQRDAARPRNTSAASASAPGGNARSSVGEGGTSTGHWVTVRVSARVMVVLRGQWARLVVVVVEVTSVGVAWSRIVHGV